MFIHNWFHSYRIFFGIAAIVAAVFGIADIIHSISKKKWSAPILVLIIVFVGLLSGGYFYFENNIVVPSVDGMKYTDAVQTLIEKGLKAESYEQYGQGKTNARSHFECTVADTIPKPGEVIHKGRPVILICEEAIIDDATPVLETEQAIAAVKNPTASPVQEFPAELIQQTTVAPSAIHDFSLRNTAKTNSMAIDVVEINIDFHNSTIKEATLVLENGQVITGTRNRDSLLCFNFWTYGYGAEYIRIRVPDNMVIVCTDDATIDEYDMLNKSSQQSNKTNPDDFYTKAFEGAVITLNNKHQGAQVDFWWEEQ